ncbi:hypothetical protein D3C71_1328410 [compost metagenome]
MNGIHVNDCVYALKRPILPFFNEWHDFVRDIRNERRRDFDTVQILKVILNLTGTDSLGVEGNNLVFDSGHVLLMLLDNQGFELTESVPWNRDFLFSILTDDGLLAFAVSAVGCHLGFHFMLLVAQMGVHLPLQHFLKSFSKQLFQGVLRILCGNQFVLLDERSQLFL